MLENVKHELSWKRRPYENEENYHLFKGTWSNIDLALNTSTDLYLILHFCCIHNPSKDSVTTEH